MHPSVYQAHPPLCNGHHCGLFVADAKECDGLPLGKDRPALVPSLTQLGSRPSGWASPGPGREGWLPGGGGTEEFTRAALNPCPHCLEEQDGSGGASPIPERQKSKQKQNTAQPGRWKWMRPPGVPLEGKRRRCGLEVEVGG